MKFFLSEVHHAGNKLEEKGEISWLTIAQKLLRVRKIQTLYERY